MLSHKELKRAARIVATELVGARLRRVDQPEPYALIFTFDTDTGKCPLFVSCRPQSARICLIDLNDPAVAPSACNASFHQYLRAHWTGSGLHGIEVAPDDRRTSLTLSSREGICKIVFSIMGPRSNIYLLDAEDRLMHALRPLEDTRRELAVGAPWLSPQSAAPPEGEDRWCEVPDTEYFQEITRHYRSLERRGDAEELARCIQQAIKKERTFLERKRVNLQEDLGRAQQAEGNRKLGELLKNVLHLVKPGADQVETVDYESGETVVIPLDTRLSPAENLDAYFARYQKGRRGEQRILEQLRTVDIERETLDRREQKVGPALASEPPDTVALSELAAIPAIRRNLKNLQVVPKQTVLPVRMAHTADKAGAGKAGKKQELPARMRPKRYRTEDGLEIWVGRNDAGNDYLTTRLARGNDLFFHLEGYPGSHVILRTEGRTDPSPKAILDACELAVHYSKMKNAGNVDVHAAPIKNVKKPKGAKAGLVYVRSGRSIRLKRDQKRLERILASRLDE